ncbi:uncharacterized protein A1O5_00931 [Cladophialophora psammophila CBS 110553]|uniref:Uncharacterized protein n=1 Tax=Cladophialophora psammophila CBS 110553 TaxID=1182543 RepID=W9X898_9EURO|nr:uncharacterized protein A1O5_00931 [Cladophialophora psammophila CBS 110553]EXJ76423.1 hypothetical protein A1O5_00931 [Cladophialophora psammophila CBS 110553]
MDGKRNKKPLTFILSSERTILPLALPTFSGIRDVVGIKAPGRQSGDPRGNSIKLSGTVPVPHRWCGHVVAMQGVSNQLYEDTNLVDFRHIIDYFALYNSSEPTGTAIRGVNICCYGEIKLHRTQLYVRVEMPETQPIRRVFQKETSPPSRSFLDASSEQPGRSIPDDGDGYWTRLWGWAPMYWNMDIGRVLVVRADNRDLYVDELRLIGYFTRDGVLNFTNRENIEKWGDIGSKPPLASRRSGEKLSAQFDRP